jgi:hypothetical protein
MAEMGGHEGQFRPPSRNGSCGFGQATFARTHGNGRDAPKAAIDKTAKQTGFDEGVVESDRRATSLLESA